MVCSSNSHGIFGNGRQQRFAQHARQLRRHQLFSRAAFVDALQQKNGGDFAPDAWMELYTPVTEQMKIDMRMNLKTRIDSLTPHAHPPRPVPSTFTAAQRVRRASLPLLRCFVSVATPC